MSVIAWGLLISAMGVLIYAMGSVNPAATHYKKGMEYLAQNNFHDAEQHFLKAVEADNLYTAAHMKLADLYETMGVTDKCLAYLKAAVASYHNQFDKYAMQTNYRIAEILYSQGKYQDAWLIFLLLFRMNYVSAPLYYFLGEMYMMHKRYGEAVNFFDESLNLDPNQPRVKFYRSLSLISMKEYREAVKSLTELSADREYDSQALFLMGKLSYDMEKLPEASMHFGHLLELKNPPFLKDVLLFKGYEILMKDNPTQEDLVKASQIFSRGTHLKDLPPEVRKEFLFHLGGVYILNRQFNDAKMVLRDLCRLDAYYKGADQLLKLVSKEMLIKEEHGMIIEKYQKVMRDGHYKHEILRPLRLDVYQPKNLPLYSVEQMEDNAQKMFVKILETQESISYDPSAPATPMDLSNSNYDTFLKTAGKIAEKLGVMVNKNLATSKYEVFFVGIDRSEMRSLLYFFKPTSVVGAMGVADVLDKGDELECKKVTYINCGSFTEDAVDLGRKHQMVLIDKRDLKKLL